MRERMIKGGAALTNISLSSNHLLVSATKSLNWGSGNMSRSFDRMCDLPTVVDDPKVREFMEHYYAISNDGADPEGFADIFTKDGKYSINDKISTGRDGMYTAAALFPNNDH